MDVWCSSGWVQFRVGAEYPGHLCHEKNPVPMIARLRKQRISVRSFRHQNNQDWESRLS